MEVERLCKDRCRYAKSYDQEYTNLMKDWERKFAEAGSNPETGATHQLTTAESYLARLLAYYDGDLQHMISVVKGVHEQCRCTGH